MTITDEELEEIGYIKDPKVYGPFEDPVNSNSFTEQIDNSELQTQISNKDYSEYVIRIIKKTVKGEDSLVRQIFYTCMSAYTNDPINLAIRAPTSEGKTYPVIETLNYFPQEDVWYIGSMSTKVLVRQKGLLVDNNNEPIEPKIKVLKRKIGLAKSEGEREDLQNEIDALKENSKTVIDLSNKIIVFLEPPNEELWTLLKPILSHDKYEIEHSFVDTNLTTKKVFSRGWPTIIVCSARDESRWSIWPEIQSRFLITSPNMIPEKYRASNILLAQKKGLPNLIQQQVIISNEEKELTKKCILFFKNNVIKYKDNRVWIPYSEILAEILPADKGTHVRTYDRILSFLDVITLVNANSKPRLVLCSETNIIATIDDLGQVLSMTQNLNAIPTYKMKWFNEVFWPCYEQKTEPNSSKDGKKSEERIAVTSRELCDYHYKINKKSINTDIMKKTYLDELINSNQVEQELSNINQKQCIYYPISPKQESISMISKSEHFDKNFHNISILIQNISINIPKNWLILYILDFLTYRNGNSSNEKIQFQDISFYDSEGRKLTMTEFCNNYNHENLFRYISKPKYCSFHSNIFGKMEYLQPNNNYHAKTISKTPNFDNKDIKEPLVIEQKSGLDRFK